MIRSAKIPVEDSVDSVYAMFYENGWIDGLPVIPPTEDRVLRMLAGTTRKPEDVVALVAPRNASATVEKIAINAVMAGCLPEYMPVLIAAVEAMCKDQFNLLGIQATTHPCAPLVVVNGPVVKTLGINGANNAFGPGYRANATIGRAIRLVLLNVGGGIPGRGDKATHGSPAKYSYCVAENEEESPWEPLSVERGFSREESTVTVFGAEGPHNITDHGSISGRGVLTTASSTMAVAGSNNTTMQAGEVLLVMGPEHARTIAGDGFTKETIKRFIWENARLPATRFSSDVLRSRRIALTPEGEIDEKATVPVCGRVEDIVLLVIGGPGKHSCFIPTFGATTSVTKVIGS